MDAKNSPVLMGKQEPIDQLVGEDDIVKAMQMAIGEAGEGAAADIREANRNWNYLYGNQFMSQSPNGDWIVDSSNPYWRPRLQRDILKPVCSTNLAVLHKLKPKLLVEADYPDQPVTAQHEGRQVSTGVDGASAAGQLQRIMESEWERRAEEILQAELLLKQL